MPCIAVDTKKLSGKLLALAESEFEHAFAKQLGLGGTWSTPLCLQANPLETQVLA